VAASQLFNAITAYTISTSASAQQARDVMFWLLGSFSGVRWPEFQLALVVVLLGLAVCLYYCVLDAFTFGDDAAAFGYQCSRRSFGSLYSYCTDDGDHCQHGGIDWLRRSGCSPHDALLLWPASPHVADCQCVGRRHLMVLADIASRILIAPQSLPVGVVTALVGVPFFAVIIYRSRNK
jgi:iron complex transport system permease protein